MSHIQFFHYVDLVTAFVPFLEGGIIYKFVNDFEVEIKTYDLKKFFINDIIHIINTTVYNLLKKSDCKKIVKLEIGEKFLTNVVSRSPMALQYIENQTPLMCNKAIKHNPYSFQYVNNVTNDMYSHAIKKHAEIFYHVKNPTDEHKLVFKKQSVIRELMIKQQNVIINDSNKEEWIKQYNEYNEKNNVVKNKMIQTFRQYIQSIIYEHTVSHDILNRKYNMLNVFNYITKHKNQLAAEPTFAYEVIAKIYYIVLYKLNPIPELIKYEKRIFGDFKFKPKKIDL